MVKKSAEDPFPHYFWKRLIIYEIILILISGCATPITVSTPLIPREHPPASTRGGKVMLWGFNNEGGYCLKNEVADYLEALQGFVIVPTPSTSDERELEDYMEKNQVKLLFVGEMDKYIAGWGIDASDWDMPLTYAIAAGRIKVTDKELEREIWSKRYTIFVEGRGQKGDFKALLLPFACKNLATKMMNEFWKSYKK